MLTHILIILTAVGLLAGIIDAIVGGGGLLTIPALLSFGLAPHVALGTNKFAGAAGVCSSTIVYIRRNIFKVHLWLAMLFASMFGALLGVISIHFLSAPWLGKIIPILIIIIAVYMAIPKSLHGKGRPINYKPSTIKSSFLGFVLGFYDGFFGPGTGSFWCTALVFFFKLDLLQATAIAKLMNFASNVIAAIIFIIYGSINFPAAIALAIGYIVGSYAGAHLAIRHGKKLIKPLFLIVVVAIAIKLIYQYW